MLFGYVSFYLYKLFLFGVVLPVLNPLKWTLISRYDIYEPLNHA